VRATILILQAGPDFGRIDRVRDELPDYSVNTFIGTHGNPALRRSQPRTDPACNQGCADPGRIGAASLPHPGCTLICFGLLQHRMLQIDGSIGTAGLALDKSHLGNDVPRYH
jgi:hypothetical protein